jgi:hypothetical protein
MVSPQTALKLSYGDNACITPHEFCETLVRQGINPAFLPGYPIKRNSYILKTYFVNRNLKNLDPSAITNTEMATSQRMNLVDRIDEIIMVFTLIGDSRVTLITE